jgi:hypothetical protein
MIFLLPVLVETPVEVATYQALNLRTDYKEPAHRSGPARTVVKR